MRGHLLRNMTCTRPADQEGSRHFDAQLLQLPIEQGRRCANGNCHESCALAVADDIISDAEAARIIRHVELVWGNRSQVDIDRHKKNGKQKTELTRSLKYGEMSEHMFFCASL